MWKTYALTILCFLLLGSAEAKTPLWRDYNKQQPHFLEQWEQKYQAKEGCKTKTRHRLMLKHWPIIASIIPNMHMMAQKELSKLGFTRYYVTTMEGYTTSYFYREADSPQHPTIAVVGGLASHLDGGSFRNIAITLAKRNGFGLIILEGPTSGPWIARNDTLISSGMEAGWDLWLKLRLIRERHRDTIPRLHVMGISLGGNDAAFAAYFDSRWVDNNPENEAVIDGAILTVSSPFNRYQAFHDLRFKKGLTKKVVKGLLYSTYINAKMTFNLLLPGKSFEDIFFKGSFEQSFVEDYIPLIRKFMQKHPHFFTEMFMPETYQSVPGFSDDLSMAEINKLFFSLENYFAYIHHPILALQAIDDSIVNYDVGNGYLKKNNIHSSLLKTITTRDGGHVGFPWAIGYKKMRTLIAQYFYYWNDEDSSLRNPS